MIDKDGNARLADFGLLTIISDSTHAATTTSSEGAGTIRWMSPELLDPERFGSKNTRPTKESDCYALGMVILEVLTGQVPFPRCNNLVVMRKIIDGESPDRPQGPESAWFTNGLWGVLEQCWLPKPKLRPTVEGVLECLKQCSATWEPLSLSADGDSQVCSNHELASAMNRYPCVFFHFVFLSPLTRATPLIAIAIEVISEGGDKPPILLQHPTGGADMERGLQLSLEIQQQPAESLVSTTSHWPNSSCQFTVHPSNPTVLTPRLVSCLCVSHMPQTLMFNVVFDFQLVQVTSSFPSRRYRKTNGQPWWTSHDFLRVREIVEGIWCDAHCRPQIVRIPISSRALHWTH